MREALFTIQANQLAQVSGGDSPRAQLVRRTLGVFGKSEMLERTKFRAVPGDPDRVIASGSYVGWGQLGKTMFQATVNTATKAVEELATAYRGL